MDEFTYEYKEKDLNPLTNFRFPYGGSLFACESSSSSSDSSTSGSSSSSSSSGSTSSGSTSTSSSSSESDSESVSPAKKSTSAHMRGLLRRIRMRKTKHFRGATDYDIIDTQYFQTHLDAYLGYPVKPYKMPQKFDDPVELEPLPYDNLPELKPHKPLYALAKNKKGKIITMRRIVGFRELLRKREAIQAMKEQLELQNEALLTPEERVLKQLGGDLEDNDLDLRVPSICKYERNIEYHIPAMGGMSHKRRHSRSRRPSTGSVKKSGKRSKRSSKKKQNDAEKGPRLSTSRKPSATGSNRPSRRKRRRRRSSQAKAKQILEAKFRAEEAEKAKLAEERSKRANQRPHPHIVRPKTRTPTATATSKTNKKGISKKPSGAGGKSNSLKSSTAINNSSDKPQTAPIKPPPSPKPKVLKGILKNKYEIQPYVPPPSTVQSTEVGEVVKAVPKKEKVTKPNRKVREQVKLLPPAKSPESAKTLQPVKSKPEETVSKSKPEHEEPKAKPKKNYLTDKEVEALRKYELRLERDAEWLELSASDKEEEKKLRAQTFEKKKQKWMSKDINYESQLFTNELKPFTTIMRIMCRLPFFSKEDKGLQTIQYLIIRIQQLPFALSSLVLWIITVFTLQGLFDVRTLSEINDENAFDNIYTIQVEEKELVKHAILVYGFLAHLFLVSIWSLTALLKDSLMLCQYLNALMASLNQMEVSGAVGFRRITYFNLAYVGIYSILLVIGFYLDSPETVRGSSGVISMLLFRSFIPRIRLKPANEFIYFQVFGLCLYIYVLFCARGILTLMILLASNLRQIAQKWNFKFGAKFGQFGLRARSQLIRLKLDQSLVKIFLHHRFIIGLTSLFGKVFATAISLYYLLQLTVLTYYLIYMYKYKAEVPGPINCIDTILDTQTEIVCITTNNSKRDDYVTAVWMASHALIDFVLTSEYIAAAGNAVMSGFEFVRRRGQIVCENSHERRLIQSLQWSFSATSPAIINVNNFFPVNRPSILTGLLTALVMFSLIIQLQDDKSVIAIDKQPCSFNVTLECYFAKRFVEPKKMENERRSNTESGKATKPLSTVIYPYEKYYWFWEDCDEFSLTKLNEAFSNSTRPFNPSQFKKSEDQLPVCSILLHRDELEMLNKTFPPHYVKKKDFDEMLKNWMERKNGTNYLDANQTFCCEHQTGLTGSSNWIQQLKFNYHICYSQTLKRYLLLQDVYFFYRGPRIRLSSLRTYTQNTEDDCFLNPYPISPLYTNQSVDPNEKDCLVEYDEIQFHEITMDGTGTMRPLGYHTCTGKEVQTAKPNGTDDKLGRDDCGWIPLTRYYDQLPKVVDIIKKDKEIIPDAYEEQEADVNKWCYSHNKEFCLDPKLRRHCPWKNFDSRSFMKQDMGYLYGYDCYNKSYFFDFQKPDKYGFCEHLLPKVWVDDASNTQFISKEQRQSAIDEWEIETPVPLPSSAVPYCTSDMTGFDQAKKTRLLCSRNNKEVYFVERIFDAGNKEIVLPRDPFSCWMKPYPNITSYMKPGGGGVYNCFQENKTIDGCGNLPESLYVGPYFRQPSIKAGIVKLIQKNIKNKDGDDLYRKCFNTAFAQARCEDPEIDCDYDNETLVTLVLYGKDCIDQKIAFHVLHGDMGTCVMHVPETLPLLDNSTYFTQGYVWGRWAAFLRFTPEFYDNCHNIYSKTYKIGDWNCSVEPGPGGFDNFILPDKDSPPSMKNTMFPCANRKFERKGLGTPDFSPMIEGVRFRLPCKDKNNKIRARIPRHLQLQQLNRTAVATFNNSERYILATVPLPTHSTVPCWESPFIHLDEDPAKFPAGVFNCWGEELKYTDFDECGWFPFDKYATGSPFPTPWPEKKMISVEIEVKGIRRTVTRECYTDTQSMERCMDPNITCKYDRPTTYMYGADCVAIGRPMDAYGVCVGDDSWKPDFHRNFRKEFLDSTRKMTWAFKRVTGDTWDARQERENIWTMDKCTKNVRTGVDCSMLIPNVEVRPPHMPKPELQFPCKVKKNMSPMIEALTFRIPCKNDAKVTKAMITRLLIVFLNRATKEPSVNEKEKTEWLTYPIESRREEYLINDPSCWEAPYYGDHIRYKGETDLIFFESLKYYHFYTCWGQRITNDSFDDCGWLYDGQYATGSEPRILNRKTDMECVLVEKKDPATSKKKVIPRKCWKNDPVALERCNDPNLTCMYDKRVLAYDAILSSCFNDWGKTGPTS